MSSRKAIVVENRGQFLMLDGEEKKWQRKADYAAFDTTR